MERASYTEAMDSENKRRAPRHPISYDVDILDDTRRSQGDEVRILDMSSEGVGIETSRAFEVGETLGLDLDLGGGRTIAAKAKIRWRRPEGYHFAYGLQFEDMGRLQKIRIGRHLDPDSLELQEIFELAVQAGATIMAGYIAYDWVVSDPQRVQYAIYALPWAFNVLAAGLAVFFISRH